jgi:soluble lytic murein transglycosylase-like protein
MYRRGDDGRSDPQGRLACGILAWKAEMIDNGFDAKIAPSLPFFGDAFDTQTRAFQRRAGLDSDGVIGPKTGSALAHKRKVDVGKQKGIPDDWLCRLITLESGNDPVAQGLLDPNDEGYAQIHLPFHPGVTLQEAWSPVFAVSWAGDYLVSSHKTIGDWEGAVVSYNQGVAGAQKWVAAGKPKYGAPYVDSNGADRDHFSDCTRYLHVVLQAAC